MGRAAQAATICFAALAVFEAALAAGAPLGEAAWGGSAVHLTTGQRVASAATAGLWIAAIAIVRGRAAGRAGRRYRLGTWVLVALLGVSALLNVASESAWETYLLAPVALVLAGLCSVVAYKAGSAAHEPDGRRTSRDARPLAN
jgi:MFS-type transporter involved in bile tolerance (Atg22 family)